MVQPAELTAAEVSCVATFIVKNSRLAEFEALVHTLVPSVRQEPGCLYYAMTKSVEQPDPEHTKVIAVKVACCQSHNQIDHTQVVFVELYADEHALQTHLARPDIAEAISGCTAMLKDGTSPVIEQLSVVV